MLDRRKPIPIYVQLKEEIVKRVKEGTYEVDTQIPTEKEFMEKYKVGRATVREAITGLVREGYLYRKQGIGTFVARKEPAIGFEPLISLTYSLKVRGISPKNIIDESKVITLNHELYKKLKWERNQDCFYLRRIRLAEKLPIAIEESYFNVEAMELLKNFDLNESLAKIILEELKFTINRVEQVIIPRNPSEDEQNILKIDYNAVVIDMERWIYINNEKEPYYYLRFVIPNDIYKYPIEDLRKN
ncbi:GntR family transcriptional regulator [Clostridium sp. MSJ-11]|uniref:GntR family transcriptional regulator n=1 Tax=Clostridium mobile TaxID=2841512 RepID=A0ABS6EJ31_9CLOT|nr:GntR family transcriptional regulator [Clostridium mobile]MBU5484691.1 GntR family transcriptional regulator [Clostridium mobile]